MDVGIVGRVFWGVEGCNAGSMRGSKEIYSEPVVSPVTDSLIDELVQGFLYRRGVERGDKVVTGE
jgi:hypothetical protein